MAWTTLQERRRSPSVPLGGTLWLAGSLFVATLCLAYSLLWLTEDATEPGSRLVVLAVAALAAIVVSSYADGTWSARATGTVELGNATRLLALTSLLFLVPSVLIGLTQAGAPTFEARTIDAACPQARVPDGAFEQAAGGAAPVRAAGCLVWWGVLDGGGSFDALDGVGRGRLAAHLDRLLAVAGAPLPPTEAPPPADSVESADGPAIARVVDAGLMGSGEADRFGPDDAVTRAQLAALIGRVHERVTGAPLPAPDELPADDVAGSAHAEAIAAVAAAGIATGDDGEFRPEAAVNSGQVALFLARTLDLWVTEGAVELPS